MIRIIIEKTMNNPFLEPFNTPFDAIPFDKIELEHYKPAIEIAIEEGKQEIESMFGVVYKREYKKSK